MENFVTPKVFLIGETQMDLHSIISYLKYTDQEEFLDDILAAQEEGLSHSEILCSFYAKACYAALTDRKNKNISKVRSIHDNVVGTINSGHGSVLEHCNINFMITDCSRIFTHELVRHRQGVAFSQSSGRFIRADKLNMIFDPILDPIKDSFEKMRKSIEDWYQDAQKEIGIDDIKEFSIKKKITSALRRLLPNGQANEIGFSVNFRALRHIITMRTSRHAESEIRDVFNQIYLLCLPKYPALFKDAKEEMVDGYLEITFNNAKV